MNYFAGLDVSLEWTSVCVVDKDGKIFRKHLQAYLDEFVFRFNRPQNPPRRLPLALRPRRQSKTPYLQHVEQAGTMCISGKCDINDLSELSYSLLKIPRGAECPDQMVTAIDLENSSGPPQHPVHRTLP